MSLEPTTPETPPQELRRCAMQLIGCAATLFRLHAATQRDAGHDAQTARVVDAAERVLRLQQRLEAASLQLGRMSWADPTYEQAQILLRNLAVSWRSRLERLAGLQAASMTALAAKGRVLAQLVDVEEDGRAFGTALNLLAHSIARDLTSGGRAA